MTFSSVILFSAVAVRSAHVCVCSRFNIVPSISHRHRICVYAKNISIYRERRRQEISIDCAYPQLFFAAVHVKIRAFASASVRTGVSHSSSSAIVIRVREGENDEYNRPEREEMTILPVFFLPFSSLSCVEFVHCSVSLYSFCWVSYIGLFSEETEREREMSVLLDPFFRFVIFFQ